MNGRTAVHIDEEKLIFLVSNYRELYDLEHKSYSDHEKRDRIWEEIGSEMNVPPNLCREKWNTLRGSYRRTLRSKVSCFDVPGTGKKRKKWRFEDEMSFLFDFIQERESSTNFVGDEGASKDAIEFEDEIKQEADTDPLASLSAQSEPASLQGAPRPKKNPFDDGDKEDGSETALDGYIRRKGRTMPSDQTTALDDNVTRFFVSMAETVKGLPPLLQAYVKAEVFKSVNTAEVRYLKESQEARDSHRRAP